MPNLTRRLVLGDLDLTGHPFMVTANAVNAATSLEHYTRWHTHVAQAS